MTWRAQRRVDLFRAGMLQSVVRVAGGEPTEEERDLHHACYDDASCCTCGLESALFFLSLDVVADRGSRAVRGPEARRKS